MKKKIAAIVIACVLVLSVGGYFVYQQCFNRFSLEFSEYYQQAEDFEELEPLLNQYFGAVQAAYDRSDKQNLETFVLDESYEEARNNLKKRYDVCNSNFATSTTLNQVEMRAYAAELAMFLQFSEIETLIAERDVHLGFGYTQQNGKDWFSGLAKMLSDAYSEYANGNGEL